VFSVIKPSKTTAEQSVQRVDNAIATGGTTNDQAIGFATTALQESTLKWNGALSSYDLDNKD
jgi:hypothetical protein